MEFIFWPPFPAKQARMWIKQELQIAVLVHHCTRELQFEHIMHVHVWLIFSRLDTSKSPTPISWVGVTYLAQKKSKEAHQSMGLCVKPLHFVADHVLPSW